MSTALQYEEALQEHGIKVSDLPEDARTGIAEIKKVQKAIRLVESRQNGKVKPETLKKLNAMDKWVYYEILDYLHDTEENRKDIPHESDEVIEEIKEDEEGKGGSDSGSDNAPDPVGLKIESELEKMFESGQAQFTMEEVKKKAPTTYNLIWDTYDDDGDNGVETSNYSLIETEKEIFTIKKI